MSLEWKKVTWYSQIVAIVLFLAVFGLGFYVGKSYEHTNVEWSELE